MSKWTEVEGLIRAKHVSLRKIVEKVFDGEDYIFNLTDSGFSLRFESTGDRAIKLLHKMAAEVKSLDKNAYFCVDIIQSNLIEFGTF